MKFFRKRICLLICRVARVLEGSSWSSIETVAGNVHVRCPSALVTIHFATLESVDRDWMAIVAICKVDCTSHLESRMVLPMYAAQHSVPLKPNIGSTFLSNISAYFSITTSPDLSRGSVELLSTIASLMKLGKRFLPSPMENNCDTSYKMMLLFC